MHLQPPFLSCPVHLPGTQSFLLPKQHDLHTPRPQLPMSLSIPLKTPVGSSKLDSSPATSFSHWAIQPHFPAFHRPFLSCLWIMSWQHQLLTGLHGLDSWARAALSGASRRGNPKRHGPLSSPYSSALETWQIGTKKD